MPDKGELSTAVEGFRQAEEALARIAADAGRLTSLGSEVEAARAALAAAGEDLKVVGGALMGLTGAHQELVNKLGSAAAALQAPESDSGAALERLDQALAMVPTTGQFNELAVDVTKLANRLESLATVDDMQEMATRLETLDDLAAAAKTLADQPPPPTVADVAEEVIRRADARSRRLHALVMTEAIAFLILTAVIAVVALLR